MGITVFGVNIYHIILVIFMVYMFFQKDEINHFIPEAGNVVMGTTSTGAVVPGTQNSEIGLVPTAEGIAYTLDDFFNATADGPEYVPYLEYLVANNNKFPVLVNPDAYETFKAEKKRSGVLSTEFILGYIRNH
jgi:hypothetical protein